MRERCVCVGWGERKRDNERLEREENESDGGE